MAKKPKAKGKFTIPATKVKAGKVMGFGKKVY